MHMDVLDRDLLLTLAAMAVKRVDQSRVGASELVGLVQVLAPALESLGDWDWGSVSNGDGGAIAFPFFTDRWDAKSLASVTGRAGYAWNRFLLYVKGGGAWLRTDFTGVVFSVSSLGKLVVRNLDRIADVGNIRN